MALLFASCDSDSTNEQTSQSELVNRVQTSSSSDVLMNRCTYSFRIDFSSMKVDVVIPNLRLVADSEAPADKIEIKGIPLKSGASGLNFAITAPVNPIVNGAVNTDYTVTSYTGVIWEYEISNTFTIITPTGTYTVNGVRKSLAYPYTKTYVSTISSGSQYEWDKATAIVALNPEDKKATIQLSNMKFADQMPTLDGILFEDLPLVATSTGFSIKSDKFIPNIGNTPAPKYEITNFSCTITGTTASISFVCGGQYSTSISARMHPEKN